MLLQEYYNTIPLLLFLIFLMVIGYFLEFRKYSQPIQKYYIFYTLGLFTTLFTIFVVTNKGLFFGQNAFKSVSQFSAIIPVFISNLIFSGFLLLKLKLIKNPNET